MNKWKIQGLSVTTEVCTPENLKAYPLKHQWLLWNGMSERLFGQTDEVAEQISCMEEAIEFRCFDETGEQHGVMEAGKIRVFNIEETGTIPEENQIKKSFLLSGSDIKTGKSVAKAKRLILLRYLTYDEDGQAEIVLSRLYGLSKGGEE